MKNKTKGELIKLVNDYKKVAEINFKNFNTKDKILKALSTNNNLDVNFKEYMKNTIINISKIKVEKPKFYYKFPNKKLTKKDLAEWYEAIETFYYLAKKYEKQERGRTCSGDRAYNNWLMPKCKELLNKIKTQNENKRHRNITNSTY